MDVFVDIWSLGIVAINSSDEHKIIRDMAKLTQFLSFLRHSTTVEPSQRRAARLMARSRGRCLGFWIGRR
jgi:hypothetical protein